MRSLSNPHLSRALYLYLFPFFLLLSLVSPGPVGKLSGETFLVRGFFFWGGGEVERVAVKRFAKTSAGEC